MGDVGRANPNLIRRPTVVAHPTHPLIDLAETFETLAEGLERQTGGGPQEVGRIEAYRTCAQLARRRAVSNGPLITH